MRRRLTQRSFESNNIETPDLDEGYVLRLRDRDEVPSKHAPLLPPLDSFSGEIIRLQHEIEGQTDLCIFEIPDLNEDGGKATSDVASEAFSIAVDKLLYPTTPLEVAAHGLDVEWVIGDKSGTNRPRGTIRTDQGNLTSRLRRTLVELKGKDGARLDTTIEVSHSKTDVDDVRIVVPGSEPLHNFPHQKYTTIPAEVTNAITSKMKGESYDGIEIWSDDMYGINPENGIRWHAKIAGAELNAALTIFNAATDRIIAKPYFSTFTLHDATNQPDISGSGEPLTTNTVNWKPSSPNPPQSEFFQHVAQLYPSRRVISVRIKRLHDECISETLLEKPSLDEPDNRWKYYFFDRLDSKDIWIEGE